ncbi:MAG: FKBP-type peptidyl-prolyl cis-trans isomerase [Prevotella sp.]|nr:FKBP-type peptidyl-prolyl cis-trans isomerase [Prevotella sp.]
MKNIALLALVLLASASFSTIQAAKKDKKKAEEKVVVTPVNLKSSSDSVSYSCGMSLTNGLMPYLQQQLGVDTAYMADFISGFNQILNSGDDPKMKAFMAGQQIADQLKSRMLPSVVKDFTNTPDTIDTKLFFRGFSDALQADTTVFSQQQAEDFFKTKQQENMKVKEERLYGPNRDAGRKFLADNAKRDSVITTPSGLQYKVLVKGEGEVPQATDKVLVNYEGRLIDGTVFDASSRHGDKPSSFAANQVIRGWTEALTMMPVGSKWQLFIPYELAYGERNAGQIKPYSALIFDVELVGIDRPAAEAAKVETADKPVAKKPAAKKRKK